MDEAAKSNQESQHAKSANGPEFLPSLGFRARFTIPFALNDSETQVGTDNGG
jgi:hypothetical protein